jgi:hypothetical protein
MLIELFVIGIAIFVISSLVALEFALLESKVFSSIVPKR